MAKIEITLIRSVSGRPETQERVVRALGLRKLNQTVVKDDNPRIRGMVDKVPHLLRVKSVEGA